MTMNGTHARLAVLALAAALMSGVVMSCGGGGGDGGATVAGRIVAEGTGLGVGPTQVTVGARTATSDAAGNFSVGGVALGLQALFVVPPAPWVAPDPDPSDPQIGNVNVAAGTNQIGNIIVVIPTPPPTP